jgi:hypothetical protein
MNSASYRVKSCVEKKRTIIYQAGEWEEHSSCFLLELWGQAPHYLSLSASLVVNMRKERAIFAVFYTDKKENLIFLIDKEIQNGAVAKS